MNLNIWKDPGIKEAVELLSRLVGERQWIIFWGRCGAWYEGRGASKATPGDRLVMIKPDRSVIVHSPHGFKPQNWQPDTSSISFNIEDEVLVMRSVRKSLREVLVLVCDKIYMVAAGRGFEEGEFFMYMTEHEIRDLIAENPGIVEDGLRIVGVERPVDPGFVDLYGVDRNGRLVVFELKRVKAGEEAARQLLAYVEHFRRRGVNVRGVLLAPDITEAAHRILTDNGLEFKRIDLRSLYKVLSERRRTRRGLLDYL